MNTGMGCAEAACLLGACVPVLYGTSSRAHVREWQWTAHALSCAPCASYTYAIPMPPCATPFTHLLHLLPQRLLFLLSLDRSLQKGGRGAFIGWHARTGGKKRREWDRCCAGLLHASPGAVELAMGSWPGTVQREQSRAEQCRHHVPSSSAATKMQPSAMRGLHAWIHACPAAAAHRSGLCQVGCQALVLALHAAGSLLRGTPPGCCLLAALHGGVG